MNLQINDSVRGFLPHFAALTLILTAALLPGPIQTSRPVPQHAISDPSATGQWLPARLWQDPFGAIQRLREIDREFLNNGCSAFPD